MTICLAIIGISVITCVVDAEPVGDCLSTVDTMICIIDQEELPVLLSPYDPVTHCYDGNGDVVENINCDEDPSVTASGMAVDDCYYWCAACPLGWQFDLQIDLGNAGEWTCHDRGGLIRPHYGERYTPAGFWTGWYIVVDLMVNGQPDYIYSLIWDWEFIE